MPRIPVTVQTGPVGTSNPATRASPIAASALGPAQGYEQTAVRAVNNLQRASAIRASQAAALPFADLNVIAGVNFTGSQAATIQHGLGRAAVGYHVVNVSGNASVFCRVPNPDLRLDASQIQISSVASCTGDVWVW